MFCLCVYLGSASGRIVFPDDEIVYQTSEAIYERGALDIRGIARRTGEPKGQPTGTFGWASGVDERRYGFFGHGLSVVALPMYALGAATADSVPESWRHAVRSNHFYVHPRTPAGDWKRLVVSLTNCLLTPIAVGLAMLWTRQLGFRGSARWLVGVGLGLGSLMWPYSRTFLSETLSATMLLGAATCVARHHRTRGAGSLWSAAALVGWSCHVHLLNLIAIPAFVGYAIAPLWAHRRRMAWVWGIALAVGVSGLLALGLSHAARFGSPIESGRYGLYSHFIVPSTELVALLLSPGRSLWLTSPILLGALLGWRRFRSRVPAAAWFCLAIVMTRLVFVAARSDWWGGWAIGPRFLVPVIPFALLPIAAAWDHGTGRVRFGLLLLLGLSVVLQAHLAQHSIFEWMLWLNTNTPKDPGYLWVSHWTFRGNPAWGFMQLEPDLLRVGAEQLARHGHRGLHRIFRGIGLLAVSSLALVLWPGRSRLRGEPRPGHAPAR